MRRVRVLTLGLLLLGFAFIHMPPASGAWTGYCGVFRDLRVVTVPPAVSSIDVYFLNEAYSSGDAVSHDVAWNFNIGYSGVSTYDNFAYLIHGAQIDLIIHVANVAANDQAVFNVHRLTNSSCN